MSLTVAVSDYQIIRQGFATGAFDVVDVDPDEDEPPPSAAFACSIVEKKSVHV
jgi:hypothetical protein